MNNLVLRTTLTNVLKNYYRFKFHNNLLNSTKRSISYKSSETNHVENRSNDLNGLTKKLNDWNKLSEKIMKRPLDTTIENGESVVLSPYKCSKCGETIGNIYYCYHGMLFHNKDIHDFAKHNITDPHFYKILTYYPVPKLKTIIRTEQDETNNKRRFV